MSYEDSIQLAEGEVVTTQPPMKAENIQGEETSAPTLPQRENQDVWEDEKADPTDRAVSFARYLYDNKDSEMTRRISSVQLQNIGKGNLPDHYDHSYGNKLVGLLGESIEYWVAQVTGRYPESDPVRVRQEIEAIIRQV